METLFFAPEVAAKRDIRAVDGLPQSVSQTIRGGSSAIRKCALSSALFRRVEVPLALK